MTSDTNLIKPLIGFEFPAISFSKFCREIEGEINTSPMVYKTYTFVTKEPTNLGRHPAHFLNAAAALPRRRRPLVRKLLTRRRRSRASRARVRGKLCKGDLVIKTHSLIWDMSQSGTLRYTTTSGAWIRFCSYFVPEGRICITA